MPRASNTSFISNQSGGGPPSNFGGPPGNFGGPPSNFGGPPGGFGGSGGFGGGGGGGMLEPQSPIYAPPPSETGPAYPMAQPPQQESKFKRALKKARLNIRNLPDIWHSAICLLVSLPPVFQPFQDSHIALRSPLQ